MIFKDAYSVYDNVGAPYCRFEYCLNCKELWNYHHNWVCPKSSYPINRGSIVNNNNESYNGHWPKSPLQTWPRNHYLTEVMLNSIGLCTVDDYYNYFNVNFLMQPKISAAISTAKKLQNETLPEWKISRTLSVNNGECPCGISRQQCSYHK